MNLARILPGIALLLSLSRPIALAGTTELVSVSTSGEEANRASANVAISADGRYLAFESGATNLVPVHAQPEWHVFVRDRLSRSTELASSSTTGEPMGIAPTTDSVAISGDGQYVAFVSSGIFVRDRVLDTTEAGPSAARARLRISADGRCVVFATMDNQDLVPGLDPGIGLTQIFLWDRVEGTTELVSVNAEGGYASADCDAPAISADCRYVAFASAAYHLVAGVTGGWPDVFVRDRLTETTEVVSLNSDGELADSQCAAPEISADGRYVAFLSKAANLVPGDTNGDYDAFVRDRLVGTTERVSVNSDGEEQNYGISQIGIDMSADGRYVAFPSPATNLVPDDTNGYGDVFIRDRVTGTTKRVSVTTGGAQANGGSGWPAISADGYHVAFESSATNLASEAGDSSQLRVYVHDIRARFSDVPGFFWAYAEIEACVNAGIVHGYPDGSYHPAEPVNRAQMAVYISRALAGGDDHVPDGPAEATFNDVPTDHWAYKYIEYSVANDIIQGYDPVTYDPTVTLSRDAMAVFISRAVVGGDENVPDDAPEATFDDVPIDHWAFKHVEYCVSVDVVQGYHDGYYHPEYTCSRAQMAVFISRAFDLAT